MILKCLLKKVVSVPVVDVDLILLHLMVQKESSCVNVAKNHKFMIKKDFFGLRRF